jgi:hypothetical protein
MQEYRFLAEQFPTSEWADDALLETALVLWREGSDADAAAAAQRLRDAYPTTGSAAGALFVLAELRLAGARSSDELEAAKNDFRRVAIAFPASRFPTLSWRGLAKARAGEISLLLGEDIEAAGALIDTIDNEPRGVATASALIAFAGLLTRQGNWQAAGQALQEVVDTIDPTQSAEAANLLMTATRRLSLLHRVVVRPAAGDPPWRRAFPWVPRGVELDRPVGVAADTMGRVIIADDGDDFVVVADGERAVLSRRSMSEPRRPWWTADGIAMVLSKTFAARVDVRGNTTFTARGSRKPGPLQKLLSGVTGLYQDWVLIDEESHRLLLFSPEGTHTSTPLGDGRTEPVDVAIDSLGRTYVLDKKGKAVLRYNPDGSATGRFVSRPWRRAEAIAIDDFDNVYVLDRDAKQIEVFGPDGSRRAQIGPSFPGGLELRDPRDIAVDGSGRLYIADRGLGAVMMLQ